MPFNGIYGLPYATCYMGATRHLHDVYIFLVILLLSFYCIGLIRIFVICPKLLIVYILVVFLIY